jgi:hypothetical protein
VILDIDRSFQPPEVINVTLSLRRPVPAAPTGMGCLSSLGTSTPTP